MNRAEERISALLFSMNDIEKISNIANKIKNYVDEIIIIDSSNDENFYIIEGRVPFAHIYRLPPIGMADLYYQIGLNLTHNNWVIHLDDDEEPNEILLKNLKKIISSANSKVLRITRINKTYRFNDQLIRIFHKDYVTATGCIHWSWGSKVEPEDLPEIYIINHNVTDRSLRKLKKYALIESYQWGYKILYDLTHKNLTKKIKILALLTS